MFKKRTCLLISIIVLAFILRIFKVTFSPPSLYWDEVALGYNSWSISQTGKDEYSQALPIFFQSFDDYKLPLIFYVLVPFVKILGPTPLAVRLPIVIIGTLTVFFTYLLVKKLLGRLDAKIALFASFLLAVSPWHLQFSRVTFESSLALLNLTIGFYLLIQALQSFKFKHWFFAGLFFVLSLYSYYTPRTIIPFIALGVFIIHFRSIIAHWKTVLFSQIPNLLLLIPFILFMFQPEATIRLKQVSIFSQSETLSNYISHQQQDSSFFSRIIYHRYFAHTKQFITNYLDHFSPEYLFLPAGDGNPRHAPRHSGLLFFIILPLLVLGLKRFKQYPLIIIWLLSAPLAASLAIDSPHANRNLPFIIPLIILATLGLSQIIKNKFKFIKTLCILGTLVLSFELFSYLNDYYRLSHNITANAWGDGYPQLISYLKQNQSKYQQVFITGEYWQPYLYFIFYYPVQPQDWQASGYDHGHYQKFYFGTTSWDTEGQTRYKTVKSLTDFYSAGNLIVLENKNSIFNLVKIIYDTSNQPVFYLYET